MNLVGVAGGGGEGGRSVKCGLHQQNLPRKVNVLCSA